MRTPNTTGVWEANFKAVYHFDGAATATQFDATANANHAAPDTGNCANAAPVAQPVGAIATALTFGGHTCDRLIAADSASLDITNELTISAWVRPTSMNALAAATIVAKRIRATEETNYEVGLWPNRNMYFLWGTGTMWPPIYVSSPAATAPLSAWSHVVWTFQGSPKAMRTYLNGVRINSSDQNLSSNVGGSFPVGTQLALNANAQPLFIGGMDQETDQPVLGDLDEVRIAATSRSPEWIKAEYQNQKSSSTFLIIGAEE